MLSRGDWCFIQTVVLLTLQFESVGMKEYIWLSDLPKKPQQIPAKKGTKKQHTPILEINIWSDISEQASGCLQTLKQDDWEDILVRYLIR